LRIVITALLVSMLFISAGYFAWYRLEALNASDRANQEKQLTDLQAERYHLKAENERMKDQLAKVQAEEERLAAANEDMAKTLQHARLTGKIPPPSAMPFPPK
jgi:peptidoglycan hydrolase CwlO-like protein